MNQVVTGFVKLGARHGCELVDVDMDSVLVVAGHTEAAQEHAVSVVCMAVDMLRSVQDFRVGDQSLRIQIGVHCGKVHAGVMSGRPRFKFFGDAVVVAREMEAGSAAQNIRVSPCGAFAFAAQHSWNGDSQCNCNAILAQAVPLVPLTSMPGSS